MILSNRAVTNHIDCMKPRVHNREVLWTLDETLSHDNLNMSLRLKLETSFADIYDNEFLIWEVFSWVVMVPSRQCKFHAVHSPAHNLLHIRIVFYD